MISFNLYTYTALFLHAAVLLISFLLINYAGEAVYVDDIPSPPNCLHGAFVYSTKPLAWVRNIDVNSKLHQDGVEAVLSYKDIPGENLGMHFWFGDEPLFADEIAQCAGQRLAFVVIPCSYLAMLRLPFH